MSSGATHPATNLTPCWGFHLFPARPISLYNNAATSGRISYYSRPGAGAKTTILRLYNSEIVPVAALFGFSPEFFSNDSADKFVIRSEVDGATHVTSP